MAIVDYSYYSEIYFGETIAESDFPKYEARAQRVINQITHGRAAYFATLPAFQQEAIKTAICAQIEYYTLVGVDVSVSGETSSGWTVGKVKVDGSGKGGTSGGPSMVCAAAIAALEQTGLMNPQVATIGDPPLMPWGVF